MSQATTIPDDDTMEVMVAAMIAQSTAYPIVPPGYTGKVEPLHPFAARQCLLAALRAQPAKVQAVGEQIDKMLADIDSGNKTRDQVIEENHAAAIASEDTRPDIGGFPLPWRIDSKSHEDVVLDADGDELMSFSKELDHGFWEGIVSAVNRSLAIEEAARALVSRSFRSVKMSKSRSIQIECNDGDRGEIVHGADYDALVEALEARS